MKYLMVFGCFECASVRRHSVLPRGRIRLQRSLASVSDWESQAESANLPTADDPRPAPWLTPSILQRALEGDIKWKFLKFPTECFVKHSPGKQEVAHLIALCLQLTNVFLFSSQEGFAHSLAWSEKCQRWVFLKYSSLPHSSELTVGFSITTCLHSTWEEGRETVSHPLDSIWNISEATLGLWVWLMTGIPSGICSLLPNFVSPQKQIIRKTLGKESWW